MKDQPIPDSDHVARHCKTSTVEGDEIMATAFMLREGEEALSVNWLEELKCSDRASEVRELQDLYARKMTRVGAGARIAILNVETLQTEVENESPDRRLLRVLHEPELDDPSHAGIYGIPYDDREIVAELIARVVLEIHPARA
ncbi:MAG: hypothetical protein HYU46_21485 [Deltaproteobacteria bacterium]|nr:hypothetical protein [Deltaproteobacteria bacterium]